MVNTKITAKPSPMAVLIFFPIELMFGVFQKMSTRLAELLFSGEFEEILI